MEVGRPRRTGPHSPQSRKRFLLARAHQTECFAKVNRSQSAMDVSSHIFAGDFSFGFQTKVGPGHVAQKGQDPWRRCSQQVMCIRSESGLVPDFTMNSNGPSTPQNQGAESEPSHPDLECFTLCKSIRLVGRDAGSLSARIKGQMGVNMKVPKKDLAIFSKIRALGQGKACQQNPRHDCFKD